MTHEGLGFWLTRRRLKSPHRRALVFGAETLTYADLAETTDRVARVLLDHGVKPGDSVAYFGENSPTLLEVMFAAAQVGAVFVPVNTRLAPPEIEHVVGDCGARVLFHDHALTERISTVIPDLDLDHVIETGAGAGALDELIAAATPGVEPVRVSIDDPAAIIYTSGTTGTAKGAVLTHKNLTWVALNTIVDYDIASTDIALMISPLFHVASLGMGALPVVLKGATMVLEKGFEPGSALAQIERHGVTMLSGVPTTYQLMADHPDWSSTDLSTLAKLTCGGSAVPDRVLNAYEARGLSFSQGYGMTETSPGATSLSPDMTRTKQGSVGLPHFFTDVRIAGENGERVPPGVVGEIEITGPNVFAGYHNLPVETAAVFTDDGWLRSGDLGYTDEDGYLFISDRLKDMIISGAENIYPAEVENSIHDMEGVTSVAVIGIADRTWGEVPWAIVTITDGTMIDTESVRAHLDGKIARYKHPKNVVVVDELPRTASGKVKKAELRQRFTPSP